MPISSATKNKLSIFQFEGVSKQESTAEKQVISLLSSDDKENAVVDHRPYVTAQEHQNKPSTEDLTSTNSAKREEVPSTPAKLALPDLIGMGDVRRVVQDISPDDRIEWDHRKDLESSSSSFNVVRSAKKRARSSSPTSSPAHASVSFNLRDQPIDPGSELWGRYSSNAYSKATPQGASIPLLAHIMYTSSPQPSKGAVTPRSAAGFRRANSCGNQFPKRRRLGGPEDDDVFTESATIGPSKLSVLIERVQEGLSQPRQLETAAGSLSSSPRVTRRPQHDGNFSALTHEQLQKALPPVEIGQQQSQIATANIASLGEPRPAASDCGSSDYGAFDDDELDESLLVAIAPNLVEPNTIFSMGAKLGVVSNPSPCSLAPVAAMEPEHGSPVIAPESSESSTVKKGDDEFDEPDEEMFNADIEHMVSRFDDQISEAKQFEMDREEGCISKRKMVADVDSDDEYGNDIEDLDFEAAEAAATQSFQQTVSSLVPVRTRFS